MGPKGHTEGWSATVDGELRLRVLVECAPHHSPSMVASLLEREGYDVRTCGGPASRPCDLLAHGSCGLVAEADVVVNLLGAEPHGREVLEAVASTRRPPAVVAELTNAQAIALAVDGGGRVDPEQMVVVETPVTGQNLVAAIHEALARRNPSAAMDG